MLTNGTAHHSVMTGGPDPLRLLGEWLSSHSMWAWPLCLMQIGKIRPSWGPQRLPTLPLISNWCLYRWRCGVSHRKVIRYWWASWWLVTFGFTADGNWRGKGKQGWFVRDASWWISDNVQNVSITLPLLFKVPSKEHYETFLELSWSNTTVYFCKSNFK